MIIIGYQGIGKSTLAKTDNKFIDLESSWTKVDGIRSTDWAKVYANIAIGLSSQGYTVFVSSHKEVREALRHTTEDVSIICPSINLKDEWIAKLEDRYNESGLFKDFLAMESARKFYDENIDDLYHAQFTVTVLMDMDYDLASYVKSIENLFKNLHSIIKRKENK